MGSFTLSVSSSTPPRRMLCVARLIQRRAVQKPSFLSVPQVCPSLATGSQVFGRAWRGQLINIRDLTLATLLPARKAPSALLTEAIPVRGPR